MLFFWMKPVFAGNTQTHLSYPDLFTDNKAHNAVCDYFRGVVCLQLQSM